MRLRGWHVEGFGLLHDFRVEGLADGLTVVFGPNEAGKTSLLAFIRGALFGYPDRRRRDRQYPPLRGGRHGGRLFLEADGSIWTVDRFASPAHLLITQPDGSPGVEADLRGLLGGVDAELYRSVFAFSLSELQEFESLRVEGVRDRIFAAGVVGAGRSARTAIETLAAERVDIGKKRGECRINSLRRRADELDELLRQAKARASRHPELRRTADELDEEQKRVGGQLIEARREMAHLDALLAAWPDWDERGQAEAEISTLADTPNLPDDLGVRLEASLAEARTQLDHHQERRQAVLDLEQRLTPLVPDDRIAALAAEVKRLAPRIGTVRARRERGGELRTKHEALEKRIEEEAPRLGPGWTSKSVREFDASIPAAQEIADWGERLREAEQALREAGEEAWRLENAAKEIEDETSRRTGALEGAPPLPQAQDLAERENAVRRLRAKLTELVAFRGELQASKGRVAESEHRVTEAHEAAAADASELERRAIALRSAPELPSPGDLARGERAVRELRAGLVDLAAARADLRAATQRVLEAKRRAEEAELSASSEESDVSRREKALAGVRPLPDAGSLEASERAVRALRSGLVDLAVLRGDLRSAETRLADRRRDAERHAAPPTSASTKRPLLAAAAVLVLLSLALATASQFVAAGVAVITALVAAVLAMRPPLARSPEDSSIEIAEAERAIKELNSRAGAAERTASSLASRLGFSTLPDQDELDARADEIAAERRALQDRDRDATDLEKCRAQARRSRESAQRLQRHATDAQAEVDGAGSKVVRDIEEVNLGTARSLGFPELPAAAALEEKAAELRDLAEKRREYDLETSDVADLRLEVGKARDAAARLEEELASLRSGVESGQAARVCAAEDSALEIAVSLDLTAIPGPGDIEEAAKAVDDQIRARREHDRETLEVEGLRRRSEAARTAARKASETAAGCRRDCDALREDWSEWKTRHRCLEVLRPETAHQFFASVEKLRESLGQLDGMAAESAKIAEEIQDFTQAVRSFAERAGLPPAAKTALAEDVLQGLGALVEAEAGLRAERARVCGELEKARRASAKSERDAATAANALTSIYSESGASDERDCRSRVATSRRRAELAKRARDAQQRLRTRLGVGAQADAVQAELSSGDRQGWETRKQACKATLDRLQAEQEAALRRHQSAVETLSDLERESDIVSLAVEREGVVAEIREALSEWRRLAIAQSLVQGTLRRYELERQPAVLLRAATSFSRITDDRYTRLVTREDGIDLIGADGGRLDAASLSRGTAEQLYLCLRLALAAEFGRLAVSLPLVMDDVLVNFDPERARLAAQVILDATPDHQVLLFTCHPETVDLLKGLAPEVRTVEIRRESPSDRPADRAASSHAPRDQMEVPVGPVRQNAEPDHDPAAAVIASIRTAGRSLSRSEILEATGLPEQQWTAVINTLRAGGHVVSHGRKRGVTWGLPGVRADRDARE